MRAVLSDLGIIDSRNDMLTISVIRGTNSSLHSFRSQVGKNGVCPQIQGRQCGVYVGAVEQMMCVVCVDVRGGIVVMDMFWRRLCVSMI